VLNDFQKNKQKTYKYLPKNYEKAYFEDGVRKSCLFRSLIREDNLQVIVEVTEIHTFGCNEKAKFIELPMIKHHRFYIVGKVIEPFEDTLLLNYIDENGNLASERVYCGSGRDLLIGV